MIRSATEMDAASIAEIYNHYIKTSTATFETETVSEHEIARRIAACLESNLPWLVCEVQGHIAGYSYASPWKARSAYRYSVESSVYVAADMHNQGIGQQLMAELLRELSMRNVHAVMSGITLPNPPSVALHEKLGMQQVAHFKQVGRKFGQWIDVGYWQCFVRSHT